MSVYQYELKKPNGELFSLQQLKDQVVLIANTASQCGLTGQYVDLQKLYEKYVEQGFTVIAVPTNQFGGQNPEDGLTTEKNCQLNYGVKFPVADLIEVNGENTHPLFQYLKENTEIRELNPNNEREVDLTKRLSERYPENFEGNNIRWNFTKFLIDRRGNVVKRFEPTDTFDVIDQEISHYI